MFSKIVILFLVVAPAVILASPFSSCGSNEPMPRDIEMSHCDHNECEVKRGHKSHFEVEMQAHRPTRYIYGTAYVYLNHQWENVNLGGRENVCEHLTHGRCPMSSGDRVTHRGELNIPKYVNLGMETYFKVRAVDQDSVTVSCFKIRVKFID